MPAAIEDGKPKLFPNLAIQKRKLSVKMASEVDVHDIEAVALPELFGQQSTSITGNDDAGE